MKTNYTIKNFRAFDWKGAQIEISPLTFLVGCNSSGKSSIVKSLFLLKEFFGLKAPIMKSAIDFSKYPINSLGTFGNAVHASTKDKRITLLYERHSVYLNGNVTVSLTIREGALGNGYISSIIIKKGTALLFDIDSDHYARHDERMPVDVDVLKDSFKRFLVAARWRELSDLISFIEARNSDSESKILKDKLESNRKKALQYCSEDYLNEVKSEFGTSKLYGFTKDKLGVFTEDAVQKAFDKFSETDILMYYPIMDELRGVKDTDRIRDILRSKVMNNNLLSDEDRGVLFAYIDVVCQDYDQSNKKSFVDYYKSLENEFIDYDAPRFLGIIKGEEDYPDYYYDFLEQVSGILKYSDYVNIDGNSLIFPDREIKNLDISFHTVYTLLAYLSPENPYPSQNSKRGETTRHPFYLRTFKEYIEVLLKDILRTDITENLDYISSSRIQVRRMYPMEDNTEFTSSVKKYYDIRNKFLSLDPPITVDVESVGKWGELFSSKQVTITDFMPGTFMNKWVKAFKIGDRLSLEMDKNGLGLLVKLFNSPSDKKGKLLADVGYGVTQFLSIVLQIETTIMSSLYDCFKGKMDNAISGIPVVPARTIAIEEPEIHLHPKYQSLLAEMFYEAYKEYNIQFIIETHSEYLLRKVQTLVGAKNLSPDEVSMIYVGDDEEVRKGTQKVRRIPVKDDGRLAAPFGPGFYDEADNLSLELFTNMGR